LSQDDTFFACERGRLELRAFSHLTYDIAPGRFQIVDRPNVLMC
jgi:pantothenate kinase